MPAKHKSAAPTVRKPNPPVIARIQFAAADFPVEVRRDFERVEYDLWYGSGFHPELSGVLRLLASDGSDAGYIYISKTVRPPYTGGVGKQPCVVIDHVPEQLPALLAMLSMPGTKSIFFTQANAKTAPFAALSFRA